MTRDEFNGVKCGDLAYVCFRKNPPLAIIEKINRTTKQIKVFGERQEYHYSKIRKGSHPKSMSAWGSCGTAHHIEKLEYK